MQNQNMAQVQTTVQNQTTVQDPDHDWKPNNRPQSTIARNFMNELDTLFNLDSSLDSLDKTVHEKKQAVSTQEQELEALQKRLRDAEERLNKATGNSPTQAFTSPVFPKNDAAQGNTFAARHPQTMDIPERPHSAHSRASVKV